MGVDLEKQRTIRDLVIEGMNTQGISEAPCIEFQLQDGSIVNVLTDTHPVLDRPASEVSGMKFKQQAEGG